MEVRMENTPSAGMNNEPVHCFIAIELSKSGWVVGFQTPLSDKTSRYQVKAGDANGLLELIERTRAATRATRSPCGSMRAKPFPHSRSWSAIVSSSVDFPVPVFPMM